MPNMVELDTCKYLEYIEREIEIEWFFDIMVNNEVPTSTSVRLKCHLKYFVVISI